jgi:hypothetical protein
MARLLTLVAAVVASILLYIAVFSVVHRPLTLGDLTQQLDFKLAYAAKLPSPKIAIFAGSNGRYSHRCQEFSTILGRPCINASIASGIGLDFLLSQYSTVLNRGDIVYMPLEYSQYGATESEMHGGVQNAVMLRHRDRYLRSLPAQRIVEVYGAFDLPFLVRGVAEMALARASFRRRTGVETLTQQGDERGHSVEKGQPYQAFLKSAPPPDTRVPSASYAEEVLSRFLADAKRKGIIVVGGLPTVPDDAQIAEADIARIRMLYTQGGHRFVQTRTASRYPRDCFYDTTYHLNESCQALHSRAAALALQQVLSTEFGKT